MRTDVVDDQQIDSVASLRKPLIIGLCALVVAFGGLSSWSIFAPIASAAIAPGTVIVDGSRKTVQHLDGGVISEILVREGDHVTRGQVLLTLDGKRLDNTVHNLRPLLAIKLARKARLLAEREALPDIVFPTETICDVDLTSFPQIVSDQRKLLAARRAALEAKLAAIHGEGEQAFESGKGVREQIIAQSKRLGLTETELRTAQELARSGAGTLRRVLEVSKVVADIQSELAGLSARAAEADRRMESATLEMRRARATFMESVESEIGDNDREQLDIVERLSNAIEQIKRLHIVAPATGQVVNLSVYTIGAVIGSGSPLLEIVPDDSPLIIEAQVRPADVGRVKIDLPVEIRIMGLNGARLPRLIGTVSVISADRIVDRSRTNSFFAVQVKLSNESRRELGQYQMKAGMSVNVMIIQEERTLFQYVLDPTISFFAKAMRD